MTTIGLIGAGVMGRALAQNLADRGVEVVVYDRDAAARSQLSIDPRLGVAEDVKQLISRLSTPRAVLLMVNAGKPVEAVIADLCPHLAPGDILIDGGNSEWKDTQRRTVDLAKNGLDFVGLGVSGGEEGARRGPALMAGGTEAAYGRIRPWLESIAARADGRACADWFGPDAGGHFVKMAHNAIEYGVMQASAEAVQVLLGLGLAYPAMRPDALAWAKDDRASYLLELTADILGRNDRETGKPLVEVISDRAGQKGTGGWAVEAALSLGVAIPSLAEAVFARTISGASERKEAVARLGSPLKKSDAAIRTDLGDALFATTLVCYAQGFQLIRAGAAAHGWVSDLARAARVWEAGCILRGRFLKGMAAAYADEPDLPNLLLSPRFAKVLAAAEPSWRRTVAFAATNGIVAPVLSSSLSYLDSLRTARAPTAMIQAMRDGFGLHGFERVDRPGTHHADWS